jgi:hypothetical protein
MKSGNVNQQTGPQGAAAPTGAMDFNTEIQSLRQVIRRGHDRWKRLVVLEAVGLAIAAPLTYLWLLFAFDAVFHLSVFGRVLTSAVFFVGVVWQGWRLRKSWRQTNFTDDQVALAMERNTPGGLDNRLINSVQLATEKSSISDTLRAAVVRENYQRLHLIHVEQVARSRPAQLRIGFAALAILAGIGFRLFQPEHFSAAATRILLPFAKIEPAFRTKIFVEPGNIDIERGGAVTLRIRLEGEIPKRLLLITREEGIRMTEDIRVSPGVTTLKHTLDNIRISTSYAVRGGDYVTPFYTISVPVPSGVKRFRISYRYPAYTGLPARSQDGTSGDIEAVAGSEARLQLTVDRPAEGLSLLFKDLEATNADAVVRQAFDRVSPTEYAGTVAFAKSRRYSIEILQKGRPPSVGRAYTVTVLEDQPPDVQVLGLADGALLSEDAVQSVTVMGKDDFGLLEAAIFFRVRDREGADWELLKGWKMGKPTVDFSTEWVLAVAALGGAEGDIVELLPRGRDNHPQRTEWRDGQMLSLSLGGDDARLQIEYEKILTTEKGLAELIRATQNLNDEAGALNRSFESGAVGRMDDKAALEQLAQVVKKLAVAQAALRSQAATIAVEMPEDAGSLKLSMGLLADTEMVRALKAVEGVMTREDPAQKKSALLEARATLERSQRSFQEILQAFVVFRQGWELEHMLPFTQMLAERQGKMGGVSLGYADLPGEAMTARVREGSERRQNKLIQLTGLASAAFTGLSKRGATVGETMATAYGAAAAGLNAGPALKAMQQAVAQIRVSAWPQASAAQEQAAVALNEIVQKLAKTQSEVAAALLAKLQDLVKDDPAAQAALKQLQKGSAAQVLEGQFSGSEISDMVALAEELQKKRFEERLPDGPVVGGEGKLSDFIKGHVKGSIDQEKERDFSVMKLSTAPSAENAVMEGFETDDKLDFKIVEDYEDVVGELLEEADDMRDTYDSIKNMLMGQDIEAGTPGKGALSMASASAAAPTGNQKPDTKEHGGVSRIGRQGARASGVAAGDESINRRGRDEAQESSQQVPDVAGTIKEKMSDDPATDHSTGVGGRSVEGELQKSFSVKDAGEWKDEMADRGEAPQSTYQIVERKGPPISAEVVEKLRAMDSQQEQLLSRIKQVKKELDNLFLPTEQLDEALRNLSANMDRLRQQPDPEAFRQQVESLEKLIGAVMVFDRPDSAFQPSLPRESTLRGEILDESVNPPLPGYEESVKRYYERLVLP